MSKRELEKPCAAPDCPNTAKNDRLCAGHRKRAQRKRPMSEPIRERHEDTFGRLLEAAFCLTELSATDDEGWERGRDRIRKAALAYANAEHQPNQHRRLPTRGTPEEIP